MELDKLCLKNIGCTDCEIGAICRSESDEEQIRKLRRVRCRILDEVHQKQKQLDGLDYMLHQIQKSKRDIWLGAAVTLIR